jgi:uncharacterized protein YndB with AHSA1/START domain
MRRDIRLHRDYPHPPALVWRALTDPALIAEWLMPNDFRPDVGHRFTMRTDPGPGFDGIVACQVLELVPPRRMRWSWRGGPIDTEVSFTLTETIVEGRVGTRLHLEQTGFSGLPAVLVSFILGAGWRRILGRGLPALFDGIAGQPVAAASDGHGRGAWWWLAQLFSPVLRRARPVRREED